MEQNGLSNIGRGLTKEHSCEIISKICPQLKQKKSFKGQHGEKSFTGLDEIMNLIESVSEDFPSYSFILALVAILFNGAKLFEQF